MVVQASSAAAKDIPAAMVIATGKPAAILAGFSKAVPESPAARGGAATAIIWPKREKALLTADTVPACRDPALAPTGAAAGGTWAADAAPHSHSGARPPE